MIRQDGTTFENNQTERYTHLNVVLNLIIVSFWTSLHENKQFQQVQKQPNIISVLVYANS
jgi:hypothetical protein